MASVGRSKKAATSTTAAEECKTWTITKLRAAYIKLISGFYCHECGQFKRAEDFYASTKTASGKIPTCKACLYRIGTNYDEKTKEPHETKESIMKAFKKADLPFTEELYEAARTSVTNEAGDSRHSLVYTAMVTMAQSLPQYQGKGWEDSDCNVLEDEKITLNSARKAKASTIKRFGSGLTNDDYIFLEDEYQDWCSRYECRLKAQEEIFERLAFKKWEIRKATLRGEKTDQLDKSFQDLLGTSGLQPKQSSADGLSDAQTLGTLIQKWETERPIPECDQELADVDRIGQYIDVFFKGHISKMLGLKNNLSHLYENFMAKYTVTKPQYDEDEDSEVLFDQIFGKDLDE